MNEKEYARRFASLGGQARASKLSPERRSEIAVHAASKRVYKKAPPCKKCTHGIQDHRWIPRARGKCSIAGCDCPRYAPQTPLPKPVNPHIGRARTTPSRRR
jgi:hypothetical protein